MIADFLSALLSLLSRFLHIVFGRRERRPHRNGKPEATPKSLAEIDGGPLPNRTSVFLHLEQGLAKSLHKPAIISTHQPATHLRELVAYCQDDSPASSDADSGWSTPSSDANNSNENGCLHLTYSQVHGIAKGLAAGLMHSGVRPNSTMLLLIPNGAEFGLFLWTSVVARMTITCADPDALRDAGPDELRHLLQSLKPSVVVVGNAITALEVDHLVSNLSLPQPVKVCTSSSACQLDGWKALLDLLVLGTIASIDEDEVLEQARNDDPNRIHSILFTSGSSGRPKGCPLSVAAQTHYIHSQSWLVDRHAAPLALQQAHPSRGITHLQTLLSWRAGGTVVMTGNGFAVDDTIEAIRHFPLTFVALSPPMVHKISALAETSGLDTSSIRAVQVGGDAVTQGILMKASAVFPKSKVLVAHGMTEGGGSFVWPYSEIPPSQIPCFGGLCPVGTVSPGSTVRIWNADEQRLCKRGEAGALHAQSGSLIHHYMFGVSESSFYDDEKGRWFVTGDAAVMDESGTVSILGRTKDVIKRSGVAIMPAPLENCIECLTGQQVVVVGIPHATAGREPYAVAASWGDKTAEQISQHVVENLGKDYAPKGLLTLESLGFESFPINATHKIVKQEVYEAVLEKIQDQKLAQRR